MEGFDPKAFNEAKQKEMAGGSQQQQQQQPPPSLEQNEPANPPATPPPAPEEFAFRLNLTAAHGERIKSLLDVKDEADFTADGLLARIEGFKNREEELSRTILEKGVYTSDKLTALNTKKALDAEKLVREDLKDQGFTDEDIEAQVELYASSGVIEKQRDLIVKKLDREITAESERLKVDAQTKLDELKRKASGAMTPEERGATVTMFKEHLNVDSIAGVSLGKTAEEVAATKEAHAEYLASGQFEKDLKANPAVYAEFGFMFKNWETVQKVLVSKGIETGKASVLERLQNPSKPNGSRPPVPVNGDGFDPQAWKASRTAQFNQP